MADHAPALGRRTAPAVVGLALVLAACSSTSGQPSLAQRRAASAAALSSAGPAAARTGFGDADPNLGPGAPGVPDLVETTLPDGTVTSVSRSSSPATAPRPPRRSAGASRVVPHPTRTTAAPPRSPTARPSTTRSTPPPNHAPVLSVRGRSYDERQTVDIAIGVSDPDSNPTTIRTSSLPGWLALRSRHLRGSIPVSASAATVDWRQGLRYSAFRITITATDSKGASSSRTIKVRVRDVYRRMPNYIGKRGNGTDGPPNIYALAHVTRGCAYQRSGNGTRIYWQSVRPRTVIRWGRRITFLFGRNRTSCRHVSGHYPG